MENFRLKVFRAVAHHRNFSRAADELLLTQPAVTQQVKALEEEYGAPLFDRTGGRVSLTAAGEILLPFAEQLKSLSDRAYEAVRSAGGSPSGPLTVGASQTIGQYLLPKFIAGFAMRHPRVAVKAVGGNTDAILEALTRRGIQLAMIEGPALRKDLRVEPFMEDHLALVVPASHDWAGQQIALGDLASTPLLMREFGSGTRRVVERALRQAGMRKKDLRIAMELDSTEGLLSGVEAGLGVAFVSRWAVRNQLVLGTLRLARVEGLKLTRMFSLAYPAGPEPSGNAGAFRRFLMEHAREETLRETGRPGKKR